MKPSLLPINRHWLAALLLLGSCASMSRPKAEPLPDGTYRVACDKALADCLSPFDKCHHGFDVVRASESRHRRGPEPLPAEYFESEAILRCRQPSRLLGGTSPADAGTAASTEAATGAQKTACFPGATQACLGPGACKGAQVCQPGGMAFGSCDCGQGSTSGAPPAEPAVPAPGPPSVPTPAQ